MDALSRSAILGLGADINKNVEDLTEGEQAHEQLINSRLAYVSVSRGRYDAQIYTNDAQNLSEELSRETSKRSALEAERSSMVWPWKIDTASYSQ